MASISNTGSGFSSIPLKGEEGKENRELLNGGKIRVLIADDQNLFQKSNEAVLREVFSKQMEIQFDVMSSGYEVLHTKRIPWKDYTLIALDYLMARETVPQDDRLYNGVQVAEAIRQEAPAVPIFLITGNKKEELEKELGVERIKKAVSGVFEKPFTKKQLISFRFDAIENGLKEIQGLDHYLDDSVLKAEKPNKPMTYEEMLKFVQKMKQSLS